MGQSLVKNFIHIVFSTKCRQPLIDIDIEEKLFGYMGGICNRNECMPIKVGGYKDHVHILCCLSQKITLAKLVEELKNGSSRWIKAQGQRSSNFYWQGGYGAFSVNPKGISAVSDYIANQRRRHKAKSYKEEYLAFLKKYEMEYDERYLWD